MVYGVGLVSFRETVGFQTIRERVVYRVLAACSMHISFTRTVVRSREGYRVGEDGELVGCTVGGVGSRGVQTYERVG